MTELHMHDSGERREFASGAVRDRGADKIRPDLISPLFEQALGEWLMLGAKKYGERNWEKGMPFSEVYASIRRHILDWALGKTDEPHMVAASTNCMWIVHAEEMIRRGLLPAELNDMPRYEPEK